MIQFRKILHIQQLRHVIFLLGVAIAWCIRRWISSIQSLSQPQTNYGTVPAYAMTNFGGVSVPLRQRTLMGSILPVSMPRTFSYPDPSFRIEFTDPFVYQDAWSLEHRRESVLPTPEVDFPTYGTSFPSESTLKDLSLGEFHLRHEPFRALSNAVTAECAEGEMPNGEGDIDSPIPDYLPFVEDWDMSPPDLEMQEIIDEMLEP
ncbi:hypothetical protein Pelo_3476 [Pelomyxa schiedti]|nr:hypothetical protein Pelo_3476 [Pelomyxa schiedti]